MEFEKLTKIEAAKRQTIEAIRLFFECRDPLVLHTIIGAAHEILLDIGERKNIQSYLKSVMWIKPEMQKEYFSLINDHKNFLKHAKTDPDHELKFNSSINEMWIYDAISLYRRLSEELPHEMKVFGAWFVSKHPRLFLNPFKNQLKKFHKYKDFEDFEFWLNILDNPNSIK